MAQNEVKRDEIKLDEFRLDGTGVGCTKGV